MPDKMLNARNIMKNKTDMDPAHMVYREQWIIKTNKWAITMPAMMPEIRQVLGPETMGGESNLDLGHT
jgi:hypothetical protein